jgi:hypothetical protein
LAQNSTLSIGARASGPEAGVVISAGLLVDLPLAGVVQLFDERVPELEKALRHRLVPIEVERPAFESEEESVSLSSGELDGLGCSDRLKGLAEAGGFLDVLQPPHERLPRVPGEDHVVAVERDGDAVEALGHPREATRNARRFIWRIWVTPLERGRGTPE